MGHPVRRALGKPRAGLFLRLARDQDPLQADRHRRGLGRLAAVHDHAGLHPLLRHASPTFLPKACPYPIFYYSALLPWMYFANSLQNATNTIVQNQGMITKVYFPRLALPLSAVLSGLVDFAIGFLMFVAMMIYYRIVPAGHSVLFFPLFLLLAVLTAARRGPVARRHERALSRRSLRRPFSRSVLAFRLAGSLSGIAGSR